jgi:prevent-host-death family protein
MSHSSISLREANQNFSRLIAAVERGEAYTITRRGREVARLIPADPALAVGEIPIVQATGGADMPLTDAVLAARLARLEILVDKLLSALSSTSHPL